MMATLNLFISGRVNAGENVTNIYSNEGNGQFTKLENCFPKAESTSYLKIRIYCAEEDVIHKIMLCKYCNQHLHYLLLLSYAQNG